MDQNDLYIFFFINEVGFFRGYMRNENASECALIGNSSDLIRVRTQQQLIDCFPIPARVLPER